MQKIKPIIINNPLIQIKTWGQGIVVMLCISAHEFVVNKNSEFNVHFIFG